jgi:hypothetical protein
MDYTSKVLLIINIKIHYTVFKLELTQAKSHFKVNYL